MKIHANAYARTRTRTSQRKHVSTHTYLFSGDASTVASAVAAPPLQHVAGVRRCGAGASCARRCVSGAAWAVPPARAVPPVLPELVDCLQCLLFQHSARDRRVICLPAVSTSARVAGGASRVHITGPGQGGEHPLVPGRDQHAARRARAAPASDGTSRRRRLADPRRGSSCSLGDSGLALGGGVEPHVGPRARVEAVTVPVGATPRR